jgi:thioesterase domain-containing protein/acyl carrier protein
VWYEINEVHPKWTTIPYGVPLPNQTVYVLNLKNELCPIGVPGELYIGGVGVALNYWGDLTRTQKSFIEHSTFGRLYKTGDVVRWLPDGNLEYMGRNDFQLKIRGYRVELEEIEAILANYKGIKQALVVIKGQTDTKYLIAYYVASVPLDKADVRSYLQSKLAEYMVPAMLVQLETLPLTSNGKIDRNALPDPGPTERGVDYVPPQTELEKQLVQIWAELLNLGENEISVEDDFFKLGGNSIAAIKLVNQLNTVYAAHLKISDVFALRTIQSLLSRLMQTKNSYTTIIKLNNAHKKPNLFMIHPGTGGCEVYVSLAKKLNNQFSCYGVDSYNLYHDNKIKDLDALSAYYLGHIEKIMQDEQQKVYHMLGWSLGGQISLKIAHILEQRNISNIKLYLLDTALMDPYLLSLTRDVDMEEERTKFAYMKNEGHDGSYIEKAASVLEIEGHFAQQILASPLRNTQVVLFKAMLADPRTLITAEAKGAEEHILKLKYNNIETVMSSRRNLKIINVANAHHGNILQKEELIVNNILKMGEKLVYS